VQQAGCGGAQRRLGVQTRGKLPWPGKRPLHSPPSGILPQRRQRAQGGTKKMLGETNTSALNGRFPGLRPETAQETSKSLPEDCW
jgi:hypothetical protein